jgi:hypothetical protein
LGCNLLPFTPAEHSGVADLMEKMLEDGWMIHNRHTVPRKESKTHHQRDNQLLKLSLKMT